jgi:hypothetical protein
MAKALNLFSSIYVLMGKKTFVIVRGDVLRDHTTNQKCEEEP